MLEGNNSSTVAGSPSKVTCKVRIPDEWSDFFSNQGVLPAVEGDQRRFARKHFVTSALLQILPSIPSVDRPPEIHAVYTKDISRDGISFLHARQVYPGEKCRLWLSDRGLLVDVVRCRRVNERCYIVAGPCEADA